MAYFPPTIDASGLIVPSYQDVLDYFIEQTKSIYGDDIYLAEDSQDYQFLSTFSLLFYDICQCLILDYNSHNPDTAIGVALDRVASYMGIKRKSGISSTALLTCKGVPGTIVSYGSVIDVNGYIWQLEKEFEIPESGEIDVISSCVDYGAIQAPIGTINKINTPTSGWESVTNKYPATIGSDIETDSELRERLFKATSGSALTVLDSILANVEALNNVVRIKGYENFTSDYDELGLPPHSIALVVEGGDENEIANIIFNKKTPGTDTFGTTKVKITTSSEQELEISFSRPEYKNVNVSVTITKLSNFTDAVEADIKNNIVQEFSELSIGQTLYASNLYYAILSASGDISSPSFFVNSVLVDNSQKVEASMFQLLTTDVSLITVIKNEV